MTNFNEKTIPIVVITGCTASGKTEIGIRVAKEIGGFIINADSKQVYSEIPIATAQPEAETKGSDHWIISGIEHYLFGTRSIYKQYTIQEYQEDVYKILHEKLITGLTPILLGGSGLYIDAVIKNFELSTQNFPDLQERETLKGLSIEELQALAGPGLSSLNESDRKNPVRLIRMIEREEPTKAGPKRDHTYYVLQKDKSELNKRIDLRVEKMFQNGLLNEVEQFREEIIAEDSRFQIIGIQEFREYFLGNMNLNQVKELISVHTRQYAKRQRTWFKREKDAIYVEGSDEILNMLQNPPCPKPYNIL